jgi:flagellin-like protein
VLRAEGLNRGVSPLIATILLVVTTLVAGGLLVEGLGRLGAPSIPPQTVVQLWTNYPGNGGVAIVHASGEGIAKAYRADILEETPMGTLLENIRWANLELRVNGVRVENEIELALITGPVKEGMNDLPGPGEALALSFKRGTLKVGDKVELIYTPLGYKVAEAVVPEPVPGRQYVDTGIQLRAARLLGRQEETVRAMKEKRFSDARRLAYELQAITRDLHDNYLAYSPYLENNLWELNRYMPDLVPENLCKTLIVLYEGGLPHLINCLELIDNIMYVWLHVDDPSLLQAVQRYQIENAALCARAIYENVQRVENLRWNSKYYTPLPGENKDSTESKIRRMEILYAIPGGFVQDLSRELYLPFLTPWVEALSVSMGSGMNVQLRIYNFGTTRVENLTAKMLMWLDNYEKDNPGDQGSLASAIWVSRYFNVGEDIGNGFSQVVVDPQFVSKPLQPLQNTTMNMWEHIVWNYGWPRLPYPTKCEYQYWWVDEHQLTQRFQNWGLTYDLTENNHPIIEYFRRYTGLCAPYTGEGGRAVYAGDLLSDSAVKWYNSAGQRIYPPLNLNPGGDYVKAVLDVGCLLDLDFWSPNIECSLQTDDQFQLQEVYVMGDDAFWRGKTELEAFAASYMNALC